MPIIDGLRASHLTFPLLHKSGRQIDDLSAEIYDWVVSVALLI
jgi:hypothetical protein